jgi:hypothetical protein
MLSSREEREAKNFSKSIHDFCRRYCADVRSGRPIQKAQPISYSDWSKGNVDFMNLHIGHYSVPSVEIKISEEDFKNVLNALDEIDEREYQEFIRLKKTLGDHFMIDLYSIKGREEREQRARAANPGVQKAWENYQLMLKLATG